VALPLTVKNVKAKEGLWNLSTPALKNVILQKSSKRNQNHSIYHNSRNNMKFEHKPKYHLSMKIFS
jgi:hypothetical protein